MWLINLDIHVNCWTTNAQGRTKPKHFSKAWIQTQARGWKKEEDEEEEEGEEGSVSVTSCANTVMGTPC